MYVYMQLTGTTVNQAFYSYFQEKKYTSPFTKNIFTILFYHVSRNHPPFKGDFKVNSLYNKRNSFEISQFD